MMITSRGYDVRQAALDTPALQTYLTYGLTPPVGTYHLNNRLIAPPGYLLEWPGVLIVKADAAMPIYGTPGVGTDTGYCIGSWGGGDYWITW